jgi:hypothetical protein
VRTNRNSPSVTPIFWPGNTSLFGFVAFASSTLFIFSDLHTILVMKRDQRILLEGRTDEEVDGRKRRRLESEAGEDEREARARRLALARVEQMTKWLVKWKTSNAVAATKFQITAPEPSPLGPILHDVIEGDSSPSP